jgi:hypothetical protein
VITMLFDKENCIFEKYMWFVVDMLNMNIGMIRLINFPRLIDLSDHTLVKSSLSLLRHPYFVYIIMKV